MKYGVFFPQDFFNNFVKDKIKVNILLKSQTVKKYYYLFEDSIFFLLDTSLLRLWKLNDIFGRYIIEKIFNYGKVNGYYTEVSEEDLFLLDNLFYDKFIRVAIKIENENGSVLPAWVYLTYKKSCLDNLINKYSLTG